MNNSTKSQFNSSDFNTGIDLKTYLLKIVSHWKWFLFTIPVALLIAKLVNDRKIRKYSSDSVISVKKESNPLFSTGTNIAFNWGGSSDLLESTKFIFRSRTHNEKVVSRLQFYLKYLKEGKYRFNDVYGKTPFSIKVDETKPQIYNQLIKIEMLGSDRIRISIDFESDKETTSLITYKTDLKSSLAIQNKKYSKEFSLNQNIETEFFNFYISSVPKLSSDDNKVYYIRFDSFNKTVSEYRTVRVSEVSTGASLLRLQLKGANKNRLVDYLNTTIKVFAEDKRNEKIAYAVKTKAYIDTLFNQEAKSLQNIEKEFGKYKRDNNIYDLSVEGEKIFEETTDLEKQMLNASNSIDYLNELERYIKTHQTYDENIPAPALIEVIDSKIPQEIGILIQKSKLRENLRAKVTDDHPQIKILDKEIVTTRNVLLENILTLRMSLKNQQNNSKKRLKLYNGKLKQLPKKEQGLVKFKRNFEITESNYNYLKQKSYEAGTAIAANVSDVKVVDSAKDLGQGPVYPNTTFNFIIAVMLGIMVPLFLIIVKELLDNKVHTVEEIQNNSSIPVLGVVGRNMTENNLAVYNKPKSTVAESFRALRSNVQFLFRNIKTTTDSKTLLLTSSISGEGKTMISINMATVFALSNKKTVLVGLDLRKPKIFDDFDLDNSIGVVNYLIGQKDLSEITYKTQVKNLDVILSGPIPPNPSELLLSEKAGEMISQLQQKYDYVVLDTPPIGLVSDSFELFKYSDAVIYVVRQNYTQRGMTKIIEEKYKNKEVNNISYVLNDFKVNNSYGYGYGYGYGNNYGYHENDKSNTIWKKIKSKLRL